MYKVFFGILIACLAFVTVTTCVFQPKMHKTVFVYDSAYEIVEPKVEVETVKSMPTQPVEPPKVQTVQKTTQTVAVQKQTTPVAKTVLTPKKTTVSTQKTAQKAAVPVKTVQTTTAKKTIATPKTVTKTTQTAPKQTQTTKTATKPKTTTQTTAKKQITEAERIRQEEILWNKWRSDLQNQIMRDTKLPIVPQGTVFKFSFDVDKFGKVTNVHTWSTTPTYTPYAIQYIAPVIRSYQGRSILTFPTGSNRVATTVEGGWKIAQTAKYSTSADYNDTERVSR